MSIGASLGMLDARPAVADGASSASAAAPVKEPVTASMQCERAAEPGRVRCTVEARANTGTIAWADVALLSLPEFASALKGRIGHEDAVAHEPTSYKWAFGVIARRAGQGDMVARVRVVACAPASAGSADAGPRCSPLTLDVRAALVVGN